MSKIDTVTRARAQHLRRETTPQERAVWGKLREINRMLGTHFRRQAPIGSYIADFADYGRKIVVEIDGGQHGGPRDVERDSWLDGQGFVVLRFWNSDVERNLDGVAQRVLDVLEGRDVA
jgi:very-short-patch-repair endonuclease